MSLLSDSATCNKFLFSEWGLNLSFEHCRKMTICIYIASTDTPKFLESGLHISGMEHNKNLKLNVYTHLTHIKNKFKILPNMGNFKT